MLIEKDEHAQIVDKKATHTVFDDVVDSDDDVSSFECSECGNRCDEENLCRECSEPVCDDCAAVFTVVQFREKRVVGASGNVFKKQIRRTRAFKKRPKTLIAGVYCDDCTPFKQCSHGACSRLTKNRCFACEAHVCADCEQQSSDEHENCAMPLVTVVR